MAEHETSDLNVHERLHAVMQEVKYIQKGDRRVNNQYRFVGHDQVVNAVHDAFVKHRLTVIPNIIHHVVTNIGEPKPGQPQTTRTEVMVQCEFVNIDKPDDNFKVMMAGYGIDNQDKGAGKAVSYAYKYVLLKTLMLETGDDPDQDVSEAVNNLAPTPAVSKEDAKKEEIVANSAEPDWQAWWDQFKLDLAAVETEAERKKLVTSVGKLKEKMSKELIEAVSKSLRERKTELADNPPAKEE